MLSRADLPGGALSFEPSSLLPLTSDNVLPSVQHTAEWTVQAYLFQFNGAAVQYHAIMVGIGSPRNSTDSIEKKQNWFLSMQ